MHKEKRNTRFSKGPSETLWAEKEIKKKETE